MASGSVGVVIAHHDPDVVRDVAESLDAVGDLLVVATSIEGATPDRVLVAGGDPLATIGQLTGPLVALAGAEPLRAARTALSAGAQDIVRWPEEADRLPGAIRRAGVPRGSLRGGRVIAVAGARGGLGTSTVAAVLARHAAGIVIDLDPGAGQGAFATSDHPRTIQDLRPGLADPAPDALEAALVPHQGDARCLHTRPGARPLETAEVHGLLRAARALGGAIFIDCGPAVVSPTAWGAADARILLVGNDAVSVRGARAAVRRPDAACIRRIRRGGVAVRDVIAAIEAPASIIVPDDASLARAGDLGRLPSRSGGALRAITKLARLMEVEA